MNKPDIDWKAFPNLGGFSGKLTTVDDASFAGRHARLKRSAQGCEPYDFDSVMTHVYSPPEGWMFIDNTIVQHDGKFHVFHIIGKPENYGKAEPYKPGTASEIGNGHAVGTGPFDLVYQGNVLEEPQGDWDCLTTGGAASIVQYNGHFVCVYTGRGLMGQVMGLARSNDLLHWTPEPSNPLFTPPAWAQNPGACKDPHVMLLDDKYFIYYRVNTADGLHAIALCVTADWEHFEDRGPVFRDVANMRGTGGIESNCVVERDGIFHLFYTSGQGMWHAISDRPDKWDEMLGRYLVGPFVAPEIFSWNGEWWLSSTRKEELRRQDRMKGISNHSSVEDEMRNLQGMFLSHIRWDGDFPVLEKPDAYM